MSVQKDYQKTIYACFVGYIVQAIVNNFAPLLFLTFQSEMGVPLSRITFLITFNFGVQLLVDLISPPFVDRIGYRVSMVLAHAASAAGLALMTFLPALTKDPFTGLLIAVMVYAVGGGLLEVLVSPVMEACPTEHKESAMSLLHSFYCWGHVGVVLLSTVFFSVFGISRWRILALIWTIVPILNLVAFTRVPIAPIVEEGEEGLRFSQLARMKIFWLLMVMMICAGASEQAVSQWASTFAEKGLGVTKTIGDLTGPMFFAIMMGIARAIYGNFGQKLDLKRFMAFSTILCVFSYAMIVFIPNPVIGLLGCGICGFSVGIFWPGTFSLASKGIRNGGTLMYALFALGGDVGCSGGPTVAGAVASHFGDDLRKGILAAMIFPVLMGIGLILIRKNSRTS